MAGIVIDAVEMAEGPLGQERLGAHLDTTTHPIDAQRQSEARAKGSDEHPDRLIDIADRVRGWYQLAMYHPFWRRYIPAAREDEGFYIGGDLQWSKDGNFDSLKRIKERNRTAVSLNHIQAVVDVLVGFERQNRSDLKAIPQGTEDAESARILTWILRFIQDQAEIQEYESECFEDGLIRGLSAAHVKNHFSGGKGLDGEVSLKVLVPGEDCLWDPYWKRNDLSDCKYFLEFTWAYIEDAATLHPEHEAKIRAQIAMLDTMFQPFVATASTDGGRDDAYGSVSTPTIDRLREEEMFFDPRDRRVLMIEAWYQTSVTEHHVVARDGSFHEEVPSAADAREMVRLDPAHLTYIAKRVKQIREALVIPAAHVALYDQKSRYENDPENFPQVIYVAKRKREHAYGIVRNMKDPQLLENQRVSQVVDILKRWGNIRPLIAKGTIEDERGIENHWSTAPIVWDPNKGKGMAPDWYVPKGLDLVARGLIEIATQFKLNLREITGINTDLLGLKSDDTSGIAIARRQAQGQIIATIFFDNFKRFRKLVGQRLARRGQEALTTEQILRLIDPDTGDPVEVLINPVEARELQGQDYSDWVESMREQKRDAGGRPYVLRSLEALKFDVTISDSPTTPSAKATQLATLMEIVRLNPAMMQILIDKIINLSDVSDRPEIMRRIRTLQAQAGIVQPDGAEGATPGPGMPPGPGLPAGPPPGAAPGGVPAGIRPAAPPAIPPVAMPSPGGMAPAGPRAGGQNFRRTLQLASGGATVPGVGGL